MMYKFFELLYSSGVRDFFAAFISILVIEINCSRSWILPFLLLILINSSHPDLAIVSVLRSLMKVVNAPLPLKRAEANAF